MGSLLLDSLCRGVHQDIDVITSRHAPCSDGWVTRAENVVLFPASHHGYRVWDVESVEPIREVLRERPELAARKK